MSNSSHPPISYPKAFDIPSSARHSSQRHKPQKGSLSGTMAWLSRSSSSTTPLASQKQPYTPSKPIRISEPKLVDVFARPAGNTHLGSGATVVRTPHDALVGSGLLHTPDIVQTRSIQAEIVESPHPSPPASPPLSSIPMSKSSPNLPLREVPQSPREVARPPLPPPQRPPPSAPTTKPRLTPIPEPITIVSPPILPPFEPILVSPIPTTPIDPFKTIVTLETCTNTYKTTLSTLTSRPSYLTDYLVSVFEAATPSRSEAGSVYSESSDIQDNLNNSIFHTRVAASGLLSQSPTTSIHIFLDRPSAP